MPSLKGKRFRPMRRGLFFGAISCYIIVTNTYTWMDLGAAVPLFQLISCINYCESAAAQHDRFRKLEALWNRDDECKKSPCDDLEFAMMRK
jgi:hypothetical protein